MKTKLIFSAIAVAATMLFPMRDQANAAPLVPDVSEGVADNLVIDIGNRRTYSAHRGNKYRYHRRGGHSGRKFSYHRGGHYLNGHRGLKYRRKGYSNYRGYWYPRHAYSNYGSSIRIYVGPRHYGYRQVARPYIHEFGSVGGHHLSRAHVNWCDRRYRSYRTYDDTFQPYHGPRKRCRSPY